MIVAQYSLQKCICVSQQFAVRNHIPDVLKNIGGLLLFSLWEDTCWRWCDNDEKINVYHFIALLVWIYSWLLIIAVLCVLSWLPLTHSTIYVVFRLSQVLGWYIITPNMCHLLDRTCLHLFKIIMSACMISVSLDLTQNGDQFPSQSPEKRGEHSDYKTFSLWA